MLSGTLSCLVIPLYMQVVMRKLYIHQAGFSTFSTPTTNFIILVIHIYIYTIACVLIARYCARFCSFGASTP